MTGTVARSAQATTDWANDPRFDTVIHRRRTVWGWLQQQQSVAFWIRQPGFASE